MTASEASSSAGRAPALPLWSLSLFASLLTLVLVDMGLSAYYFSQNLPLMRTKAPAGQQYEVNIANGLFAQPVRWRKVTYRTNEFGFRGPSLDRQRPLVLMLGDSFLFGLYLDEGETLPAFLQKEVQSHTENSKMQVVNGAIPASGLAEWVAFLEDYGQEIAPSVVILGLNYSSVSRAYRHKLFQLDANGELLRFDPRSQTYQSAPPSEVEKLYREPEAAEAQKPKGWYRLLKNTALFALTQIKQSALFTLQHRAFRRQKSISQPPPTDLPYNDPEATDESVKCICWSVAGEGAISGEQDRGAAHGGKPWI
jgi:hypothetical protein